MVQNKTNTQAQDVQCFIEKLGYLLSDLDFNSTLDFDYSYIVEKQEGLFHYIKPSMESVVSNDNLLDIGMTLSVNTKDTYIISIFDPTFLFLSIDPSTTGDFSSFEIEKQHLIVYLKVILIMFFFCKAFFPRLQSTVE